MDDTGLMLSECAKNTEFLQQVKVNFMQSFDMRRLFAGIVIHRRR
jgi:hypothetical protein